MFKPGDKVTYAPFEGCKEFRYENGIVKDIFSNDAVRVVYNCANDWDHYYKYTSALTPVSKLKLGWYESDKTD